MNEAGLKELVEKIVNVKAEFQTIEVKRSKTAASSRLYDTLSSFSNQDDGGIIVFGIDEKEGFEVVGVDDVQLIQKQVSEQCEQMEPPVRAVFTAAQIDGKNVVSAEIPPIDITKRPCFYKGKGRLKGSYVRVGEADIPMSEYEVCSYEAYREKYRDDIRTVERADMSSLDEVKLADYLMRLKSGKPNLARLDDEKIYELMSISHNKIPTLSSEMLFGLYPQAFFPQLSIIAVCVQGTQIGDKGDDGERFIDNKRIEGTIPEMLEDAIRFVQKNTRTKTIIDPITAKRTDKPDYPVKAVREAILNALVHRDYSIHTEGMPIQIMVFSDRLEIKNPGGLYGRLTLDALGKTQPDTRNPVLATALELMGVTENRYSGIPTIRNELEQHGLPQPEFAVIRGEFCVTFHLKEEAKMQENKADKPTLEQFCKTPRSRKEITEFLGIRSATYAINKYVIPLIEQGKLFMEIPDKPTSRNQRFYSK